MLLISGIDLNSLVELGSKMGDIDDVARKARYHYNFIKFAQVRPFFVCMCASTYTEGGQLEFTQQHHPLSVTEKV